MVLETVTHMLSFDVEEYFHVEAVAHCVKPEQWSAFEKRLPASVERVLNLLAEHDTRATFFILGWVAKNEPEVVKRIAAAGHEIASHGMNHQMLSRMTLEAFRADLLESKKTLEDLTGQKVVGYRAPTFSVMRLTAWAIDVLAEAGFEYDSSIFPVRHDRYGVPDAPTVPHTALGPGGGKILELPPLVWRTLGTNVPVGGGGYLRLLPTWFLTTALTKRKSPGMIYLHPWELDAGQPELPLTRAARFRHRVNLDKTEGKLRKILSRFRFSSVRESLAAVRENSKEEFAYGGA
jgi:polysaccharide deacetylase family protein (PEP-CTERM system associated)